ncbi:nucleotidyltransferase family protein [Parasphingorhabdus halotolerans]|uniref:Nucleotidyltransferase family protein n=1 Tax=Parasphingorhabdus halotolerans TaxID=2725558 RepID=A0A6H2DPB3_9SPHN|nr:nucleotidyltransferase family protein [Parasphingorhabdus halotolerans]QJB69506.1 nucleotidyltransferase family protein [Parasphingorhabdus halotolerans]
MSEGASSGMMLAILAAGSSRRFGKQDKLTALLHGKMLGLHAAEALAKSPFDHRAVIASSRDHPCAQDWRQLGYDVVVNREAADGQSRSVNLAAQTAVDRGARGLCICLADMPFVTAAEIEKLAAMFEGKNATEPVASSARDKISPPAIFPASSLNMLTEISGDQGARQMLEKATLVQAPAALLQDIDTPEMLNKLNIIQ